MPFSLSRRRASVVIEPISIPATITFFLLSFYDGEHRVRIHFLSCGDEYLFYSAACRRDDGHFHLHGLEGRYLIILTYFVSDLAEHVHYLSDHGDCDFGSHISSS